MGGLQGFSELFPISSLGHSVILPSILGWSIDQGANFFLVFLVATHVATSLVLFWFFREDWFRIIRGIFRSLGQREIRDPDAKLGWLLVVGTVPAGILGVTLEQRIKLLFASPNIAAIFLAVNGLVLFTAEFLRRRHAQTHDQDSDSRIAKISWVNSLAVGSMQALALIPGLSRTGSAMTGGLLVGLSHEDAARYSFLLATPVIMAAGVFKLPDLTLSGTSDLLGPILVGAVCSAVAAYFSVRFLTRYFKTNTLIPFAGYCLAAGVLSSLYLFLR